MNNSKYVETRLDELGIKRTLRDNMDSFRQSVEAYRERESSILTELLSLQTQMSKLEGELKDTLPALPGAQYIHDKCGFKTGFRIGDDTSGDEVYYCGYCDVDFQI